MKIRFESGFLMIEAMVAIFVIAIGLLGAAVLQAKSLQFAYASNQRTLATIQANDLIDRLWTSICKIQNSSDLATVKSNWKDNWKNDTRFTSWSGDITGSSGVYTISIGWTDSRLKQVAADASQSFNFTTSIPKPAGCPA